MRWPRAARKFVDLPVRSYDRDHQEVPLTAVEIATVAPGTNLTTSTVWRSVSVVQRLATIYVVGPDAGTVPGGVTAPVVSIPTGGLDLYVRPTDALESDPKFVDRFTLL